MKPQMMILMAFKLMVFTILQQVLGSKYLIQTLQDEIGAENFTYYRLHRPGMLRLELFSISGDVDIYISTETQQPNYEVYYLKSETCGIDVVSVDSSIQRPVYIGIYGHPFYLSSKYKLSIYEVDEPILDEYESFVQRFERYHFDHYAPPEENDEKPSKSRSQNKQAVKDSRIEEENNPLWWKILLGFIEFGLEVIL